MNVERWAAVPDFPDYEVSDQGRVRSWLKTGYGWDRRAEPRILRPGRINGYARLLLHNRRAGTKREAWVHRLVLEAFVGPAPEGHEACHNNGVRDDNRAENLRWDTRANNHADKAAHGTAQRGERANAARLTEAQVLEIRRRRAAGERIVPLAREFGVGHSHIARICLRRIWTHI